MYIEGGLVATISSLAGKKNACSSEIRSQEEELMQRAWLSSNMASELTGNLPPFSLTQPVLALSGASEPAQR